MILVNTVGSTLFLSYFVVFWMFTVNTSVIYRQFFGALLVLGLTLSYTDYYEIDHAKAVEIVGKCLKKYVWMTNLTRHLYTRSYSDLYLPRLHLLWNYSFILCCTMLYANGCISKKMYRNVTTAVNFDVIHRFSAMVCIWPHSKWSISSSAEFYGCSIIRSPIGSILYIS